MASQPAPETPVAGQRFTIICRRCQRPVLVLRAWIRREVACPHCNSVVRVPEPPTDGRAPQSGPPHLGPRELFHFACPRCDVLLEANTGMCGQIGRCPTCNSQVRIPAVDVRARQMGEPELVELADDERYATHAYAAAGGAAPTLVATVDGGHAIECPRCSGLNEVDADLCAHCGAPFVLEAAATRRTAHAAEAARIALLAAFISIPLFLLVVPGLVAVVAGGYTLFCGAWTNWRPWVAISIGTVTLTAGIYAIIY